MVSPTTASSAPRARSRRPPLLDAGYTLSARALRVFPAGWRHAAATPGGAVWFWLNAGQRRAALDNYAAALGREPSDPEVGRVARRAFQNYGRMLMDFLLIGSLSPSELESRVTYEGREHLDAALARGTGAILALPHMGSWDVAGSFAGAIGYKVTAVTERFPGSLNDAVVRTRQRFGLKVVTMGRSAVRALTTALQSNEIVALVCDLEQGPGITVSFFGRRATVPGGPAAIALKTGTALIPCYVSMTTPGHYHVKIERPLAPSENETKETLMQRVIDRFQVFIRERPDEWYAFRPMFQS